MPVNVFTTLDDPLASDVTAAQGINAAGQIVGAYFNASGLHGFLYRRLANRVSEPGHRDQGLPCPFARTA